MDGGVSHEEHPWDTFGDPDISKKERWYEIVDLYILTPARVVWSDLRARVGVAIILLYLFVGLAGPHMVEPTFANDGPRYILPFQTAEHPFGTDGLGQDILAQLVHATPPMLKMITAGAVFSTIVAVIFGVLSGYLGGFVDRIMMVITDVVLTIPGLPLVIVLAVILDPRSPWVIGIVLTVNAWAGLARNIRSQVLTLRQESYVEASRALGAPTYWVTYNDILPNIMPYVTVNFANSARSVIFSSVGLYFLGVLPFSTANWGVMMNQAYGQGGALYSWNAAHWLLLPMGAVVLLSFGLILFAQGTDRLFNPRVRARHAKVVDAEDELN